MIKDKTIVNTIDTATILTCSCNALLPKKVSFSDNMLPLQINMDIITVPPKIWRPKAPDKFISLPPNPDVDDNLFLSPSYGLDIRQKRNQPPPLSTRDSLMLWNDVDYNSQLQKCLHPRDNMDITVWDTMLQVI